MVRKKPKSKQTARAAPLHRALSQSEQVVEKVQEAAQELADVNAVLKDDVAAGVPLVQVQLALDKSEAVEVKVQEAADELVAVNDALAEEIDERDALEHRVSQSDSELTKSRAAERKARHRALHQPVTQLPNATLFGDRLAQGIEQALRHRWQLAVMFIDLDGFKRINDAHGHDAGDRVLQTVARRLRAFVRGGDSVGHRSGDEFLLLMLEVRDDAAVTEFAAKLRENIAEPIEIEGGTVIVGSSIGIALYPEHGASANVLLKCADQMMYAAKRGHIGVMLCDTPSGR